MVTFLFCTKTICLGSDHKAKPKKRRAFLSGRALYVPHFSATAERRPIRWDPKAQSLKAVGVVRKRRSRESSVYGTGFGSDLLDLVSLG